MRRHQRFLLLLFPALLACRTPPAETVLETPLETPLETTIPASLLQAPLSADGACGSLHQDTGTQDPEARALYDQGMACLATFDWVRSARSFHSALRADPALAMAYSGLARAYLGLEAPTASRRWAERGRQSLAPTATPYERRWIQLAVVQLKATLASPEDRSQALEDYRKDLERSLLEFPRDPHLLALRGHAEQRADDWGQGGGRAATAWYQAALALDPDFFPVHHFLAHSFENQGLYGEALSHARRFAELAPRAPHAHHMVAHTAPRNGRWQEALEALEAADALHRQRFLSGEISPESDWHYVHNLRLTAAVALHQGQRQRAREAYRATFELEIPGHRGGFYCGPWIEFLLWDQDSAAALEAAETCRERKSLLARAQASAYRGEALLDLGRLKEAQAEEKRATAALERVLRALGPISTEVTTAAAAQRSLTILRGKLLVLVGDRKNGITLLGALAEDLSQGPSFDAWASAQTRLRELHSWAERQEAPQLGLRVDRALAHLDGTLEQVEVASLSEIPTACH